MSQHVDVGNVGIYGSAIGGVATATSTWADVINANAMAIGLGLTALSLLIGVIFKVVQIMQNDRHHREEMAAQREDSARLAKSLREEIRAGRGR